MKCPCCQNDMGKAKHVCFKCGYDTESPHKWPFCPKCGKSVWYQWTTCYWCGFGLKDLNLRFCTACGGLLGIESVLMRGSLFCFPCARKAGWKA